MAQTNLILQWNASEGAGSYRIYSSEGTASFTLKTSGITITSNTVMNINTSVVTRFYVTAYNAAMAEPESLPSNIVTNNPTGTPIPPPVGTLVVSAPTFIKTNLIYGESFSATAVIKNANSTGTLSLSDTWIVSVSAGGTQTSGPWFEFSPHAGSKTLAAGASVSIPGSFTVPTNGPAGTWLAYLTGKDSAGAWLADGPTASFTVSVPPAIRLPAPTNLRSSLISGTRVDIAFNNLPRLGTRIERAIDVDPFFLLVNLPPGVLHTTTMIKKNLQFTYRAQAFDPATGALSDYSNSAIVSYR